MPGRLFLTRPVEEIADRLNLLALPPQSPRRNIAPGQEVLTVTPEGGMMMRWGMIPVGRVNARGRPVMETIVNARSETLFSKSAFSGTGRAVVPADGWYEWSGPARRKTPWAIRRRDGAPLFFAAITDAWTAPGGATVQQVATITCEPNAEVRPVHHRMGAILTADLVDRWLTAAGPVAHSLLGPAPDGTLEITEATGVDWSGL